MRLALEGAIGVELALCLDDSLHGVGTEGPDQLVLQVLDAHEEPEGLHLCACQVGAEAGPLETTSHVPFLRGVTQPGKADAESVRTVVIQEASEVLRPSDRHDGHALGSEIAAAAHGERLDRALVTFPFDEDDRPRLWLHTLHGSGTAGAPGRALTSKARGDIVKIPDREIQATREDRPCAR